MNDKDTIYRDDAIIELVFNEETKYIKCEDMRKVLNVLKNMPSTEPEQSIAEWQKDFREYINMLNIPRDDYNGIMEYINEVPFAQQCMTATSNTMVSETVKIPVMDGTTERLPSAESEQQWIPCSETKENPDHEILACGRRGEMIIGYLVEYSDDQWLCESETEILYDAVAWREKPKPYTERSQDD